MPRHEAAARRARPSMLVIGVVALALVALLGLAAIYGLGLGPFAPAAPVAVEPTTTPEASATSGLPSPISTPSTQPTASGAPRSPSPTIAPVVTASPNLNFERLLAHVPPALREDCVVAGGVHPILASATCSADAGQVTVTYLLYASVDQMRAAYDGFVVAAGIERDSGACGQPETWPAETEYRLGETVAGRLLCADTADQATVYWADERLSILSLATHAANDPARVWRFWLGDSGPDL